MEHRRYGRSGLRVSPLSLGAMPFGEAKGFLKGVHAGDAEARKVFEKALEAGIDTVDTANGYAEGRSEELPGSGSGPPPLGDAGDTCSSPATACARVQLHRGAGALAGKLSSPFHFTATGFPPCVAGWYVQVERKARMALTAPALASPLTLTSRTLPSSPMT